MDSVETFKWEQLARRQKIYIVAAAAVILAIVGGLIADSWHARQSVKEFEKQAQVFENQAIQAERDKQDALTLAAETGTKIKIAEEQLSKVEVKRNETRDEIKAGGVVVSRSRAEYERAVHERLPNVPSTDALCKQLADAGHPCYPN